MQIKYLAQVSRHIQSVFVIMKKEKSEKMTPQETIKQLNILLSRERYLLGCSSDEQQRSQMIEALEVAKRVVEESEVKHGEWVLLDECANEGVYCSVCHKKVYKKDYANQKLKSNYCPNCGAKMDKE